MMRGQSEPEIGTLNGTLNGTINGTINETINETEWQMSATALQNQCADSC